LAKSANKENSVEVSLIISLFLVEYALPDQSPGYEKTIDASC
jgi:hypothetical protein